MLLCSYNEDLCEKSQTFSYAIQTVITRSARVCTEYAYVQGEFSEIANKLAALAQENNDLTVRVSELEQLDAQLRKQLARERRERKSAKGQVQACEASRRGLEAACKEAASQVCLLQNEVVDVKHMMSMQDQAVGEIQVRMQSLGWYMDVSTADDLLCLKEMHDMSHTSIEEARSQAHWFREQCRTIMIRILSILNPDRIVPFALSRMPDEGAQSTYRACNCRRGKPNRRASDM